MDHVDTYLMHHGVKGQQWGNKHGPPYPLDDNPSKQAYKKKKAQQASSDSRKEQKKIAKQERAEYKKKKLPRTSLGLALKNSTMSDAEFREASKKLKRDREVYDGIISDMYRLERAVNLPGMFLNDGVKAIKNIDYIYGLITGSSMTEARRTLARSNSISNRMVGKKNTRIAKNNTGLYYGVGSYLSGDSPRAGGSAAYKNFLDSRLSTKMGDAIPMNMISTSEYDRLMSQFKHSDLDDNYLCHYGVLGMKWGRRKARPDVNSERRKKLNKVKAKVRENLKPWQINGSYKQNTYNHNQSPYQETTKVTASGGININPLSAEKTNEYAQKIYELKQRIPRLYHSDLDDNFLCHYGRKGMKWGQHIFGEDPNEKKLLSSPKINKTKLVTSTSGDIEGEIYDSAGNKKETEFSVHKEITFPPLPKLTESEMTDLFKDVSKNFPKMDKKAKEEILYDIKNTWLKEPDYLEKDHPFRKMSDEDILKNISYHTDISYDMAIPNTKYKDRVSVWYSPKSDDVFPGAYSIEYVVDKDEKGNKVYKYDYFDWND